MESTKYILMLVVCIIVAVALTTILIGFLKYLTRLEEKRWGKVARANEWNSGLARWLYKLAGGQKNKR